MLPWAIPERGISCITGSEYRLTTFQAIFYYKPNIIPPFFLANLRIHLPWFTKKWHINKLPYVHVFYKVYPLYIVCELETLLLQPKSHIFQVACISSFELVEDVMPASHKCETTISDLFGGRSWPLCYLIKDNVVCKTISNRLVLLQEEPVDNFCR